MAVQGLELRRFREELRRYAQDLNSATYWRYQTGKFPPPFGDLLVNDPQLAKALADDIAELHTRPTQGELGG